jgi:hypothetical protein
MKFIAFDLEMKIPDDLSMVTASASSASIGPRPRQGAPNVNYNSGRIIFSSPTSPVIDLLWERLDNYKKESPSVNAYLDSSFNNIKTSKRVSDFDSKKGVLRTSPEHEYMTHELTYTVKAQTFSKPSSRSHIGVAMYDYHSNRFAILFASWDVNIAHPDESIYREMVNSFNCNCNKGKS